MHLSVEVTESNINKQHHLCRVFEPERINRFGCDDSPVAMKCAVVSRWACRKRRLKNSPCMREEVVIMAGRKEMF
jgi:hypothetical protein